jgi:hypothetical protein
MACGGVDHAIAWGAVVTDVGVGVDPRRSHLPVDARQLLLARSVAVTGDDHGGSHDTAFSRDEATGDVDEMR